MTKGSTQLLELHGLLALFVRPNGVMVGLCKKHSSSQSSESAGQAERDRLFGPETKREFMSLT